MGRVLVPVAAAVAATALLGAVAAAAPARPRSVQLQRVTLIGDSVADAISGDPRAVAILRQGVMLDLEVEPCRRVEGEGCPYEGNRPPSVVDLVRQRGGAIGPNVVVSVGYNDFQDEYARNVEDAVTAMEAVGVTHVWWLTLRAAHHPYLTMNDDIEAAAARHPEMRVIDWNVYSRSHPSWFQDDGLHLLAPGAEAMATLIHETLLHDGVAAPPVRIQTGSLPEALRGKPYRVRLKAAAGVAPYRWSLLERAPAGLHLKPGGTIVGRPTAKPGAYGLDVQVEDGAGSLATRRLTLRIA